MPKKVMFLLDKSDDEKNTLDAMRSTLGLSVANHYSYAVVLNHTLGKFDDYNAENLEWIRKERSIPLSRQMLTPMN